MDIPYIPKTTTPLLTFHILRTKLQDLSDFKTFHMPTSVYGVTVYSYCMFLIKFECTELIVYGLLCYFLYTKMCIYFCICLYIRDVLVVAI